MKPIKEYSIREFSTVMQLAKPVLPLALRFESTSPLEDFLDWYCEWSSQIDELLLFHGGILFRGLRIDNVEKFDHIIKKISGDTKPFLDGNSKRAKYSPRVYESSELDSSSKITLHTEFSYSNVWPAKIYFCSIIPATSGGQTSVASGRRIFSKLDPKIVGEFEKKKITYIRNLHDGVGFGPSWMEAFESHDKNFVEQYCKHNEIDFEWKLDNTLKLVSARPAIRNHPTTNEKLWFNQVDHFWPAIFGREVYETLLVMCQGQEDELPVYARFGDGTKIPQEFIDEILRVFDEETVLYDWEIGDLLILDNMLTLHGRMPFSGPRKTLVAMS